MSAWTLGRLLHDAFGVETPADTAHVQVTAIAQHLDGVTPGALFIARRGARVDAHTLIPAAIARGAVAVVGERRLEHTPAVPYLQVADGRGAVAALAASFYHHPSRRLQVAGVTGTDGKTTSAALLHHLLQGESEPVRSGLMSTAVTKLGGAVVPSASGFTTPEATEVQAFLARCQAAGAVHAVIEASSHASALQRLERVHFRVMGWTNLSPEHLDLHGTFEAYREAKLALVRSAEVAVLNRDDPAYPHFAAVAERGVSVGFHPEADVRAEGLEERDDGWRFTLMAGGSAIPPISRCSVATTSATRWWRWRRRRYWGSRCRSLSPGWRVSRGCRAGCSGCSSGPSRWWSTSPTPRRRSQRRSQPSARPRAAWRW
jgi:UDP-N-acetylmuramoyl-L-alanyl-D-glutamate--2,6-diaminopimelate ligase